jgi:hypothetical protein
MITPEGFRDSIRETGSFGQAVIAWLNRLPPNYLLSLNFNQMLRVWAAAHNETQRDTFLQILKQKAENHQHWWLLAANLKPGEDQNEALLEASRKAENLHQLISTYLICPAGKLRLQLRTMIAEFSAPCRDWIIAARRCSDIETTFELCLRRAEGAAETVTELISLLRLIPISDERREVVLTRISLTCNARNDNWQDWFAVWRILPPASKMERLVIAKLGIMVETFADWAYIFNHTPPTCELSNLARERMIELARTCSQKRQAATTVLKYDPPWMKLMSEAVQAAKTLQEVVEIRCEAPKGHDPELPQLGISPSPPSKLAVLALKQIKKIDATRQELGTAIRRYRCDQEMTAALEKRYRKLIQEEVAA